ncbi:hypothetical protein SK128_014314 [Halocaridina rubra]|uniref:Uncharacterized protein n=1 Tax=Halocaridina rubra TaxID=373956 RepID=A0AAN8X439_HALRR
MHHGNVLVSTAYSYTPAESQESRFPVLLPATTTTTTASSSSLCPSPTTAVVMDDYHDKRFIRALRVPPEERSYQLQGFILTAARLKVYAFPEMIKIIVSSFAYNIHSIDQIFLVDSG